MGPGRRRGPAWVPETPPRRCPALRFPEGPEQKAGFRKSCTSVPVLCLPPPPRFLKAVLLLALALGETVAPLHSAGSVKAGGATQCRGGKWGGGPKLGSDSFLISLPKVINRASPARLRSQDLGGLCLSLVKEKHFQEQGYMEDQETFLDAATERYRSRVFLHPGSRESTQGGREERYVALLIAHQKRARLQNVPGALPTPLFRQHVTVALMPCGFSERSAGLRARDGAEDRGCGRRGV